MNRVKRRGGSTFPAVLTRDVLQPDILWSVSKVVRDPGNQGGVHLHPEHFFLELDCVPWIVCSELVQKHDQCEWARCRRYRRASTTPTSACKWSWTCWRLRRSQTLYQMDWLSLTSNNTDSIHLRDESVSKGICRREDGVWNLLFPLGPHFKNKSAADVHAFCKRVSGKPIGSANSRCVETKTRCLQPSHTCLHLLKQHSITAF